MNILLHGQASPGFRRQSGAAFEQPVMIVEEPAGPELDAALARADVLLHILTPVNAEVIAKAPRLKLIQKLGVGVNTIDLDAARARGIAVANMPGTNSQAVAEQALALMFAVLRRVPWFDARTRAGQGWGDNAAALDDVGEIAGRTVGLIDFGHSAQRLAKALDALGARVIYTARSRRDVSYPFVPRERLLAEADVVSLHAPLTEETRGMIDPRAMKRGAVLINTARGEMVDEDALVEALESGHLRGAGLDVFAQEPVTCHPLFGFSNVVLSPHIAWLTPETLARSLGVAHENCRRLAAGESLLHQVV
ncbi:MAG: 2-hydroxyacid dehydrogenase [Tsuneonella sp.]